MVLLVELNPQQVGIKNLWPEHVVGLAEFSQFLSTVGVVEAHPKDLESRRMVLLINASKGRQRFNARSAPSGPEVEQDDFPFVIVWKVHRRTERSICPEGRGFVASMDLQALPHEG